MNYLSICSGIEAATQAWHPLGWQPLAFAEIEPFPAAVLAHHHPHVPNLGDFTRYDQWPLQTLLDTDLLVGGTPCQAFSVAGLRQSLQDDRGNLTLTLVKLYDLITHLRHLSGRPAPLLVWENVPGVLNTPDNAFGCFLAALAGENDPLHPPGGRWKNAGYVRGPSRAIAWRILDAQYFGLAQRRRRVFLVAGPRDSFHPEQVLFESTGQRRDTPPRRETGQSTAPTLSARTKGGGGLGTDAECDGALIAASLRALNPTAIAFNLRGREGGAMPELDPDNLAVQRAASGGSSRSYIATREVAGSLTSNYGKQPDNSDTALGPNLVSEAIAQAVPPVAYAIQKRAGAENPNSGPDGIGIRADDCAYTLEARQTPQAIAAPIAFSARERGDDVRGYDRPPQVFGDVVGSLDTMKPHQVATTENREPQTENSPTYAVRRLTPTECERLQGFPDHHTQIPWRGKPSADCPDGPRYKALGNSMAVPVMHWIGQRLQPHLEKV